jgi:hypothetical protein
MKSDNINELAAALVKAQAEFSAVPKGSVNPFFKSTYAALPDVVAHATPILAKHGLAISQFIDGEFVVEGLTTYLLHTSGQYIAHTMKLHLVKDDPQAQGSAVTYARRYAYMSALGLVADTDDDGNAASQPRPQAQARPAQPAPKPVGNITSNNADIQEIIEAAKLAPTDEFLNSLAEQYAQRGQLSDKQIAAGKKKAYGVLKNNQVKSAKDIITSVFESATEIEEEPF